MFFCRLFHVFCRLFRVFIDHIYSLYFRFYVQFLFIWSPKRAIMYNLIIKIFTHETKTVDKTDCMYLCRLLDVLEIC